MALTAKREKGKKSTPIEPGTYQAVCYGLYDIGKQYSKKYEKFNRQVVIIWEIPELLIEFEKDGVKKTAPRAISMTYNNVLGDKATLRKHLESWRGRPFTDEELDGFDLVNILGKNCLLQIMNKKSEVDGNIYSNIANILPLMKGMQAKEPVAGIQHYSMEENMEMPEYTPAWIKEKIMASVEMKNAMKTQEPNVGESPATASEDDCPF